MGFDARSFLGFCRPHKHDGKDCELEQEDRVEDHGVSPWW
jgi:hypothetical protein